jgi:ribosomal protein S18 acetylase RimI-like enzyme
MMPIPREPHAVTVLAAGALPAARALLDRCNRTEQLALPIEIESGAAMGDLTTSFAVSHGNTLAGYGWLPEDPEPEGCLMVDPDERRRGIGRALLQAMRSEAARRGLARFLLVADQAATSVPGFLAAVGARHEFSEYQMTLDPERIDRSRPRIGALHLRPASAADRDSLVRLRMAALGDDEDRVQAHVDDGLSQPNRRYLIALLDGEPVGMLRTGVWGDGADITSFGVVPEQRGKGYGRQILLDAVDLLRTEGWERILIEVATDNANALGLYESCGFRAMRTYGYFTVRV